MTKNMGSLDRGARAGLAAVLVVVAAVVGFGSVAGIIALIVAAVMGATAAVGFCPLYVPLRLNTCHRH